MNESWYYGVRVEGAKFGVGASHHDFIFTRSCGQSSMESRFFADDTAPKRKLVSFSLESEIGRAIRPPWPLARRGIDTLTQYRRSRSCFGLATTMASV
jgi:hypothetical protein